jgi:transposase
MKRLKPILAQDEYAQLEGMMWIIRKNHECLSKSEKATLELMYKHSPLLKEAHKTALKLTHIFNTHNNRKVALTKVNRWIQSVQNSGFVEGLNNKIKVLKRRCYGLSKPESLFQRLFLDLRGYIAFS